LSLPFREQFFSAEDGLRLYARLYGEGARGTLPLVCLSGLTRNSREFHPLACALSCDGERPRRIVALDYRGRGRSEHDRDWRNYNVLREARDVVTALTVLGIERAVFIGSSRGALVIMTLAAIRPAAIAATILNDAGPVMEGSGLARIRSQLEHMPKPASFEEAVRLLRAAHGAAFPALGEEDWERMARAIYREENGKPVPDFDPALLKTLRAVDLSAPLPVLWPQFHGLSRVPMLAIRGEHSDILSAQTLEEMKARHPDMESITVEGQGHTPLLETAGLPARIDAFLGQVERRRG
jgi:pimeloyl-ACP methyl ester carboxylesterase